MTKRSGLLESPNWAPAKKIRSPDKVSSSKRTGFGQCRRFMNFIQKIGTGLANQGFFSTAAPWTNPLLRLS